MKTTTFLTPRHLLLGAISSLILASPGVFAVPSQPSVTQNGSDLRLSWTGNTGTWLGIDRSFPGCGGTCYENIYSAGPTNEFTDTNVSANVAYRYKVYDGTGHNGYSPARQLTNTTGNTNTNTTAICADPTINGTAISFGDSSCWYQLQNLDAQNYNLCQGNGAQISSCGALVPGDKYLVKRFRANPWQQRPSFTFTAPGTVVNTATNDTETNNVVSTTQREGQFPLYYDTPGITDLHPDRYDYPLAGNYFFDWFLSPYKCAPGWQGPIEADVNGSVGSANFFFSVDLRNDNSTNNCTHVETDIAVTKTAWRNQPNGYSKKIASIEKSSLPDEANLRVTAEGRWSSNSSGRGHINMTAWLTDGPDRESSREIDVIIHGFDNSGDMAANDGWEELELDEPLMMRDAATGANTAYRIIKRGGDFGEVASYNIQPDYRKDAAYKGNETFPTRKYDMRFDVMKVINAIIVNDDTGRLTKQWYVHDLQWTVTGQNETTIKDVRIPAIDGKWTFNKLSIPSFSDETESDQSENWDSENNNSSGSVSNNSNTTSTSSTRNSSGGVCTVMGNTFNQAITSYGSQCSLPRKDCDLVNGKWYCSSASVSANPVVTTGAVSQEPAPTAPPAPVIVSRPDTEAPIVSHVSPGTTTTAGAVTISGNAVDDSGVKWVRSLLLGRSVGNKRYNFKTNQFSDSIVYADTVKVVGLTNQTATSANWGFSIANLEPGNYRLRTKIWDKKNNSTPWGVYDFTVIEGASERQTAMSQAMAALEAYKRQHGTFKVANSGWRGGGSGWFFYDGTNYPTSVADALTVSGNPVIHTDPLFVNSNKVVGDFLIYHCKDRVGLFSRHGTSEETTSNEDSAWWGSNGCPTHPVQRLNANYFILSQ